MDVLESFLASFEPMITAAGPFQELKRQSFDLLKRKNIAGLNHMSLRQLSTQRFLREDRAATITKEQIAPAILPSCERSYLVFVNGRLDLEVSDVSALSNALMICSLESGFSSHYTFLHTRFKEFLKKESDPFALLNFSVHELGAFIYVPAHSKPQVPLQMIYVSAGKTPQLVAPKIDLALGSHSELSVFISTLSLDQDVHFQLPYLDLLCDHHSSCSIKQCVKGQYVMQSLRAALKHSSKLSSVSLHEGGSAYRSSYHIQLKEEGASVNISGLSDLRDHQASHVHGVIEHQSPHTESMQVFKAVQQGVSRSSYSGKIKVEPQAQKTMAYQLNNTLLLSPHAIVISEPNLEIQADDVKASHGATITQLREEELFYCKSRGIDETTARRLLVEGFCTSILSELPAAWHPCFD